jgi:hypothetical protein
LCKIYKALPSSPDAGERLKVEHGSISSCSLGRNLVFYKNIQRRHSSQTILKKKKARIKTKHGLRVWNACSVLFFSSSLIYGRKQKYHQTTLNAPNCLKSIVWQETNKKQTI